MQVNSAAGILDLLEKGNARRKTESTEANATSSRYTALNVFFHLVLISASSLRSHAVFQIDFEQRLPATTAQRVLKSKLCLVDLAGRYVPEVRLSVNYGRNFMH